MTKFFKNNLERVQLLLTLMIWLLLFAIPLLFGDSVDTINWHHVFKIWKEYLFLFVIFLVNRYVLMPGLFFKEKRIAYFISITGFIIFSSVVLFFLMEGTNPPPALEGSPFHPEMKPPGMEPPGIKPWARGRGPGEFIPPYANLLIMSILLIGFDSGLQFFGKWMQSEQNKLKAEKESIANKMAFLQNQVSPHFFMNTLNNIHALVDIDTEEAKDAIIRLSQMMDYMLYESTSSSISLKQELDFITSYVELMKLRLTEDVELIYEIPENVPNLSVPPLLTISFIENAFKYGISYENPSYIHIYIKTDENMLSFIVKNRIHNEVKKRKSSGIGIENARKRLDLIYGKTYQLSIKNENNQFEINLNIPV